MKEIGKILCTLAGGIELGRLVTAFASKQTEDDIFVQYLRIYLMENRGISKDLIDAEIDLLYRLFYAWKENRWMTAFGWLPMNKDMKEVQEFLKKHHKGGE